MAQELKEIPGIDTQFSQYIEDNVNEAVSGVKSELAIKLYGDDPRSCKQYADQIVNIVNKVPGATDVGTDLLMGQPQIQIIVDRRAIARYGVAIAGHAKRGRHGHGWTGGDPGVGGRTDF